MKRLLLLAFGLLVSMVLFTPRCYAEFPDPAKMATPVVAPEELGMDADALDRIDALVEAGIQDGDFPGAVVAVGRGNKIGFLRAYGNRQTEPTVEKATFDTTYDLASVTKVTATAISIAILVERGLVKYDDKISKFFPDFAQNGKEDVTVLDCLTHTSGFTPDNSINDYIGYNREEIFQNICKLGLRTPRGEAFAYSDVGFITLGYLIEKLTGVSEDEFVRQNIYLPLGMVDTGYNPNEEQRARAAAAEKRTPDDEDWIKGQVHDPRAYEMKGVAGHAGNFSTATDLAILASMLIGHGTYTPASGADPVQIMTPETFKLMTEAIVVPRGIRSRGWDKRSPYSGNRAVLMSPAAIGHSGFTGTSYWIDADMDLFVIFLGNRLHPDGKGNYVGMCGKIGQIALDSIHDPIDEQDAKAFVEKSVYRSPNAATSQDRIEGETLAGVDVLARDDYALLKGKKVGLLTNQTGRLKDGRQIPKAMQDGGVELTTLFSPEHGLYGALDQANIDNATDPETGLRVYSLYGEVRRPTPEMIKNIDAFVFDIQDVGVRFYTYISAMCSAMQAAADMGKEFVVLDRPNPIGGVKVDGPWLDPGCESYVAFFPMPIQHGMTVGEIALAFAHYYKLNLKLTVVPCENWSRDLYFDQTGLTWVNPSPNMRSLTEALLYPGLGIPEFTNLSVGRGTDTPFEVIGAPWINADDLAKKMTALNLPGVSFEPITYTPTASKYADEEVHGLKFTVTDRNALQPVQLGVALMTQLAKDYPENWELQNANTLLLNDQTLQAIKDGQKLDDIVKLWNDDLERFNKFRAGYLIY
ncbi:MAG: DUF1343 domain-containing protein [Planctomycetia bacterium]|nr:DUF1343 domain-containing protein [Planctomycetia bacterium]